MCPLLFCWAIRVVMQTVEALTCFKGSNVQVDIEQLGPELVKLVKDAKVYFMRGRTAQCAEDS